MTQQNPYQPSVPPNSSTAIVSLVAGILGLSLVPGIASVVAVITGNMAMKEIRASGGSLGGEGMARIGLILGWIGVALVVISICCVLIAVVFPFLLIPFGVMLEGSGSLPGIPMLFG